MAHFTKSDTFKSAAVVGGLAFVAGLAALPLRRFAHQSAEQIAAGGDWFEQLKLEHKTVDALFDQLLQTKDTETKKRAALLLLIKQGLFKHAIQEEDVVYPMLREHGVEADTKELYAEHADIKTYLHELEQKPKDDPSWIARVEAFATLIRHHVREEEDEIYPRFREKLSDEQNKAMTKRMNAESMMLM